MCANIELSESKLLLSVGTYWNSRISIVIVISNTSSLGVRVFHCWEWIKWSVYCFVCCKEFSICVFNSIRAFLRLTIEPRFFVPNLPNKKKISSRSFAVGCAQCVENIQNSSTIWENANTRGNGEKVRSHTAAIVWQSDTNIVASAGSIQFIEHPSRWCVARFIRTVACVQFRSTRTHSSASSESNGQCDH